MKFFRAKKRPYEQILNRINRSMQIKKHCSRDVQRKFLRAPSCRAGACSRRFGSMKSVCNGGTKAPPYNAPLTHLRWELPPRGAFRKKLPRRENAIIHNRLRVTLSGAKHPGGMFCAIEPDLREGNAAGVGVS